MLTRVLSGKDCTQGNKMRSSYAELKPTSCNPKIAQLKEKLQEKQKLLYQLEKQEKDFLGFNNQGKDSSIFRIEFEATTCKDYCLVPGYPETFIPAGKSVIIFGQLRNKRWRCVIKNDNYNSSEISTNEFPNVLLSKNVDIEESVYDWKKINKQYTCCYPLIGSIPSSIISELNNEPNDETTSKGEESITETNDNNTDKEHTHSSTCKCGRHLSSIIGNSRSQSCSFCQYSTMSSPVQIMTAEHLEYLNFQSLPSMPSVPLPTLPESPTEATIAELNMALESLAKITPRSRPILGQSDGCNDNSWTAYF